MHELSDAELDGYLSQFGALYGGAVADAELPPLQGKFWVCLMTPKGSSDDGHWTLVYDCRPDRVLFMDSMGVSPTTAVQRRMEETGKVRQYSNLDEQGLRQINCGWLCAYVAKRLVEGASFQHILRDELHPLQFADNQRLVMSRLPFGRPAAMPKSSHSLSPSRSRSRPLPSLPMPTDWKTTVMREERKIARAAKKAAAAVKRAGKKAAAEAKKHHAPHKTGGRCGGKTAEGKRCKNAKATCPHKH